MLTAVAIANYRSLRDLVIPLKNLNIVTGANGSGKSNVYRALRLLGASFFWPLLHVVDNPQKSRCP